MSLIDIVIPCAGRTDDLLRLLGSLHTWCAASLPAWCASITVTDDRHSVGLGARVAREFPQVRYVPGPARGPAANRNHGAALGQAEWVLFLDDDCYVESDLLGRYAERIRTETDVVVFEGAIHPVGSRPNGNHHAPLNTSGGVMWSCNLLIRRREFAAVGGFDEEFPFACMEDCDLMLRLDRRHAIRVFAHDAVVLHPWRSVSEREVSRQIISHAIYGQKHPAFVAEWTLLHVLRAMRGRLRQYRSGRFSSIPLTKYRTVGFDAVAPVLVYAVLKVAPLRRGLWRRHRNAVARAVQSPGGASP